LFRHTFDADEDSEVTVAEVIGDRAQVVELVATVEILDVKGSVS